MKASQLNEFADTTAVTMFPFFPVGPASLTILLKNTNVSQFMKKNQEKLIGIQVAVDAQFVCRTILGWFAIAKLGKSLTGDPELYAHIPDDFSNWLNGIFGDMLCQGII